MKKWVQFYDTILNRHFFCIHATVNIRNSISDVLGLKFRVQIPESKNMSSVFRTWKIWVQFSGLNFWDLEKIDEKNQKKFKVPKVSKIVRECPNVFRSNFFEKKFAQCSMEGRVFEYFLKKTKTFQISKHAKKSFSKESKRVLNMLWSNIFEKFLPSVPCRAFQTFWT